ncbi:hypothetical protein CgunFtcFv8_004712 [Champsocephalus gunnari]|uniref:Uncharacterized protein n=1 Tax=Champsocephalus gunnari TaxID=52237 RepID=A0AAN8E3G4_CHAGU|nr:hypothetical protein CgunFtcFv8_004712 [Champsocephalus gunnari]
MSAFLFFQVSDVGSEKLFSPTTPKGVPTNECPESKPCSAAKVSGLQRSQEQSIRAGPFTPPVPSPTPASALTGPPAPAAAAPEPPRSFLPSPPPLSFKRELQAPPPLPTPPLLRAPPHPQLHPQSHPHFHQDPRVLPPQQHHARPVISQVHHPLQYSSLHDLSHSSSPLGLPQQHLPPPLTTTSAGSPPPPPPCLCR